MSENFGFGTDENGYIQFMQVYTDFEVNNFEDYKEVFKTLHMIALENPGVMPILVFGENNGEA